jgi:fermentation-respiration switch protein FrsA (DUF1100 family)
MVFPARLAGPRRSPPRDARVLNLPLQPDNPAAGYVEAWFFAAANPLPQRSPAVIFFHGNAELISQQQGLVQAYKQMGLAVLLVEYRGYGGSAGHPSQQAIVADSIRFYDQLLQQRDIDPNRIIFHGRSLGGAIAAQLAAKRKPAALILQSTPANLTSMAKRYGAPALLVKNPFRTDKILPTLTDTPILMFHGTRDRIIKPGHAETLARLTPHAKLIWYPAGHSDFPGQANVVAYWRAIKSFLIDHDVLRRDANL